MRSGLTRHGFSVLCVQGLVDLIEQVERCRVALLDGENESERHERFLTSRQLLHLSHLSLLTRERYLRQEQDLMRTGATGKHRYSSEDIRKSSWVDRKRNEIKVCMINMM